MYFLAFALRVLVAVPVAVLECVGDPEADFVADAEREVEGEPDWVRVRGAVGVRAVEAEGVRVAAPEREPRAEEDGDFDEDVERVTETEAEDVLLAPADLLGERVGTVERVVEAEALLVRVADAESVAAALWLGSAREGDVDAERLPLTLALRVGHGDGEVEPVTEGEGVSLRDMVSEPVAEGLCEGNAEDDCERLRRALAEPVGVSETVLVLLRLRLRGAVAEGEGEAVLERDARGDADGEKE